ncbi:MAG: DUF4254 domain-containing protein [Planctomycetota bacterium]
MLFDSPAVVRQIVDLQTQTVRRWHEPAFESGQLDNPYTGLLAVVCQQHQFNYLLWHQEDLARCPDAGDAEIASVKRAIDKLNQQRNDWIERIDETFIQMLSTGGVIATVDARLNTETPGSAIDRLSIMSLRIFHMEEELQRQDADGAHLERVQQKLARCGVQQADLSQSLQELLQDIFSGSRLLKVYRQMKMYNDPTLNPVLYKRQAG